MTDTGCIDAHAHYAPRNLLADLTGGTSPFPHIAVARHETTFTVSFNGAPPTRPVSPGLQDSDRRSAWMNDNGIDRQVIGGWLDMFGYNLPDDEGADWALALTESIVDAAAADDRLIPLATVPLQSAQLAAEAVVTHRSAGRPGVMIATRAGERELDDPAYTPFWQACHDTGATVFLHPGFGGASARYQDFGLVNGLARLEDTTVSLARLLYAGVPARYPGARIVVAHGGAGLPYVMGRLAQNHAITPSTADPVESFHALYFDSVVFDPKALTFLIGKVGADHVLLGSDYPFPIGDLAPRKVVDSADVEPGARPAVFGGTAARVLFGAAA